MTNSPTTANCDLPTNHFQLTTANCEPPTNHFQLTTANCEPPTNHFQLITAIFLLQTDVCQLRSFDCQLPTMFLLRAMFK